VKNQNRISILFIYLDHGKTTRNAKAVGTYRHHSTHRNTTWNDKTKIKWLLCTSFISSWL